MRDRSPRALATRRVAFLIAVLAGACTPAPPTDRVRVSGQIEATDVHVASPVGRTPAVEKGRGRAARRTWCHRRSARHGGQRTRRRPCEGGSRAGRSAAQAAASRKPRRRRQQAQAQVTTATAEVGVAEADLAAAEVDVQRFEQLLAANSGSRKQRDDAVARRECRDVRARAGGARARPCGGADGGRVSAPARVAKNWRWPAPASTPSTAQIATIEKAIADATVTAPVSWRRHDDRRRRGRTRSAACAAPRHHRSRSRVGQCLRRRAGRAPAASRRPCDALHRRWRVWHRWHDQLHLGACRVHATKRSDSRRPVEACLSRQGVGGELERRVQVRYAGRSGDYLCPLTPSSSSRLVSVWAGGSSDERVALHSARARCSVSSDPTVPERRRRFG